MGHDETGLKLTSPCVGCEFWINMKLSIWRAKNPPDRTMMKFSALAIYIGRSGGQGTSV
jgi:hypothetical protein